ncbi:MAG: hypothetical protein WAU49_10115 [Steroidobacteraceae bacterium]
MKTQAASATTKRFRSLALRTAICAIGIGVSVVAGATSASGASPQESQDDAWWTGPLLAPNAATLPQGHWLIEPYVYDSMTYGRFDRNGTLQSTSAAHSWGSQSYIEYGLTDGFTLGLIPRLGLHESSAGQDAADFTVGDTTLQGAFGLTRFHQGSYVPDTSLVIGETFPTGKYDQLDGPTDGAIGSGAYSTTISLYSQMYFWMPNGRILRTRLDLSYQTSQWASVHGMSVYGTSGGFDGRAHPGPSVFGDLSFEYSLTRSWVLASDFWWQHDGNTQVRGSYVSTVASAPPPYLVQNSGSDDVLYVAPAIEYNWSAKMGVIVGARIMAAGRNADATVSSVAAINMFF